MSVQPSYREYVLEQLAALSALRSNRMFGCVGLYSDGIFFGLIDDDTLFFKTGESNIAPYRERKMPRFMPFPDRPEAVLGYYQVPADVIEDAEAIVAWARGSIEVALAAKAMKAKSKGTAKRPAEAKPARKKPATPVRKAAKKRTSSRKKPRR